MNALKLAVLCALLGIPVAAQQAAQTPPPNAPPKPSPELVAASRVPIVDMVVTDGAGAPIQPATVRWRGPSLAATSGVARTGTNGRLAMNPGLQYSATTGWRFTLEGVHRFEISADGFQTAVLEMVDLKPGTTAQLAVTLQPLPPRRVLAPDVYRQKLLELAAKTSAEMGSAREVRVVGDPVVMPEAVRTVVSASAGLPEAVAIFAVYEKGKFRDVGLVSFIGETANSRLSNTDNDFEQLDENEWQQMARILEGFYAEAVDVTRGPERFVPYLPDNMRQMLDLRGEKNRMWLRPDAIQSLSNDQLRRFVSLMFDNTVLNVWMELSGLTAPPDGVRPADIRRDPVAAIASLERSAAAMRKALTDGGLVAPERMAAIQMYLRRLLGEGYMVREDPARDGIKLPRGARMYTVMLGGPLPHVIVDNGKVRVVAVDFF